MVTDRTPDHTKVIAALSDDNWTTVRAAIDVAEAYLRGVPPGDAAAENLTAVLADLAEHAKWEVRRAVAKVAGRILSVGFEPALLRLLADDNARVRQAAQLAMLHRRDWRHTDALGQQHDKHINAQLADIEARFGTRGREAVKRISGHIANTFAREVYHEVIKLVSPLVTAADRLRKEASTGATNSAALSREADRIARQVTHLGSVLGAMRAYAAVPDLQFASESLHEIVEEAAQIARAWKPDTPQPIIQVDIPIEYAAEVVRPRFVQALTNLLINAVDAYEGLADGRDPVRVHGYQEDGITVVAIVDAGCGMSPEVLHDAPRLFSTNKLGGTGFGLPIAIKIIEAEHTGRIDLQSTKGVGTAITVRIPSLRPVAA